jgi:hypothetical protein
MYLNSIVLLFLLFSCNSKEKVCKLKETDYKGSINFRFLNYDYLNQESKVYTSPFQIYIESIVDSLLFQNIDNYLHTFVKSEEEILCYNLIFNKKLLNYKDIIIDSCYSLYTYSVRKNNFYIRYFRVSANKIEEKTALSSYVNGMSSYYGDTFAKLEGIEEDNTLIVLNSIHKYDKFLSKKQLKFKDNFEKKIIEYKKKFNFE